jgi:hypothetical protein
VSVLWPDWPEGDDQVEYADPADEYAAIDASTFFVPYNRVHLKTCPTCGDTYINAAYLKEHITIEHPARDAKRTHPAREPAPKSRPASVPAPADAAKVRPLRSETEGASGASGASRSMRPEPESVPPARVPNNRGRRRGAPRSKPKRRD